MYLPWPADKTLTEAFEKNISDMEKAIGKRGLDYEKIVVFISTSSTKATLYEITCKNGICKHDTLKNYTNPSFTTAKDIAFILSEMKSAAPALTYAMIIGGHGMGWIPVYPTPTIGIKHHPHPYHPLKITGNMKEHFTPATLEEQHPNIKPISQRWQMLSRERE